jgi:hypothetical protein
MANEHVSDGKGLPVVAGLDNLFAGASTLLGIWLWKGTICNDENQHRQSPS